MKIEYVKTILKDFDIYILGNNKIIKSITPDKKIHLLIVGEDSKPTTDELLFCISEFFFRKKYKFEAFIPNSFYVLVSEI